MRTIASRLGLVIAFVSIVLAVMLPATADGIALWFLFVAIVASTSLALEGSGRVRALGWVATVASICLAALFFVEAMDQMRHSRDVWINKVMAPDRPAESSPATKHY